MEEINIKSDTLNKGIDLVAESSIETRKAFDKNVSGGLSKLFSLLNATPLGIKLDTYIAERPYKLELSMKRMQAKYQQIPIENQVEPSSYIALKGVNELNYALDEEHLREMFENLLISDMDNKKKSKVLPAYIDVVKQLSKDDAEFLKVLKETHRQSFELDLIVYQEPKNLTEIFIDKVIIPTAKNPIKINEIVFNNLDRLKIIEWRDDMHIPNSGLYELGFNQVKSSYTPKDNYQITYKKGVFEITKFGKNFIDICLS